MTALNRKYQDKPGYQLAKQKYLAMSDGQRAIMSTQGLDDAYMNREISKQLQLEQMGMQKKRSDWEMGMGERKLAESQRQFDLSMGEQKKQFGEKMQFGRAQFQYGEEQRGEANSIARFGVLIGLASGLEGYMHQREMQRYYKTMRSIMEGRGNA